MSVEKSIIWRRLDVPGHEYARISSQQNNKFIDGTAIFVYGSEFCRLDYSIKCSSDWRTEAAKVTGSVGAKIVEIEISVEGENIWKLNGKEVPDVTACVDLDLNFSPVTNTLPIRRLNLAAGEKSSVRAAWLRFPSFQLEPLAQVYERTGENTYRYESAGGRFTRDIETDDLGLVVNYPDFWKIENTKQI